MLHNLFFYYNCHQIQLPKIEALTRFTLKQTRGKKFVQSGEYTKKLLVSWVINNLQSLSFVSWIVWTVVLLESSSCQCQLEHSSPCLPNLSVLSSFVQFSSIFLLSVSFPLAVVVVVAVALLQLLLFSLVWVLVWVLVWGSLLAFSCSSSSSLGRHLPRQLQPAVPGGNRQPVERSPDAGAKTVCSGHSSESKSINWGWQYGTQNGRFRSGQHEKVWLYLQAILWVVQRPKHVRQNGICPLLSLYKIRGFTDFFL